ncbi:hypothetical protein UFOVP751_40 [uncultured Caudovirales phage]|uniref:Uncharacterized protein n=1 Tax=uncultured Caudovirales phage TaxID=2100421 RepID=A0A6J7XQL6_9CAUD|nr:hypothetical protein UFOVP751_40 [uncultured Caudovirales phage]
MKGLKLGFGALAALGEGNGLLERGNAWGAF